MANLEALYETVRHRMSWLEFAVEIENWNVQDIVKEGRIVAVVAQKGAEFHFASFGGYAITRRDILGVLGPIFAEFGHADTRTPAGDTRQQRFNERFGFKRIGENETEIHYRIFP